MSPQFLHRVFWGLQASLLLTASSNCLAQQVTPDDPPSASMAAPTPISGNAAETDSAYRVGVGDVLHITVWEEPQFTEVATVRPDGMISLPLVSDVAVAGMTTAVAEAALTVRLEKFVHKPRVTVTVQDIRSRMVYITGEVQRPGAYPLVGTMDLVQLVSRSGGLTDFAKRKRMYVLRKGETNKINIDYGKVLNGQTPKQNLELAPGDTVVVP